MRFDQKKFHIILIEGEYFIEDVVCFLKQNSERIKRWAYILHDQDGLRPHYHIYIVCTRYDNAFLEEFFFFCDVTPLKTSEKQFLEYCLNRLPSQVGRYQYAVSDIVANFNVEASLKENKTKARR